MRLELSDQVRGNICRCGTRARNRAGIKRAAEIGGA